MPHPPPNRTQLKPKVIESAKKLCDSEEQTLDGRPHPFLCLRKPKQSWYSWLTEGATEQVNRKIKEDHEKTIDRMRVQLKNSISSR